MIERLRLVNFKSHADTVIEPGRLTALVGPNGAGKTSVLQALKLMIDLAHDPISDVFKGDSTFELLSRTGVKGFCFEMNGRGMNNATQETRDWNAFFQVSMQKDKWNYHGAAGWGSLKQPGFEQTQFEDIPFWGFQDPLGHAALMKVFGKNLQAPSYTPDVPPRLGEDGSGLASVVSYLKGNDQFEPVLAALKTVIPAVKAVRIAPAKVRVKETRSLRIDDKDISYESNPEMSGQALVFDFAHASNIPATQVSEGTLMTLAILTLLYSPECPTLILIDDIETALHPKAQCELVAQLRKVLDLRPALQIVFTTHSVYIVDGLDPKEVWGLATDEQGISHCARLSEAPNVAHWRGVLSTGELWDAEGEDWIIAHGTQQSA